MTDTPRAGDGDIPVTIDGEDFVLTPTFEAAKALLGREGGLVEMVRRVGTLDLNAVSEVIAHGLGYGMTKRPPKDLPQRIWRTGITDESGLTEKCIEYLHTLANGGRRPPDPNKEQEGPTQTGS